MGKKEFEEVSIPKWKLAAEITADTIYRVFKSEEDFQEVEATSANEAMQKAGVEDAFEIRLGAMDRTEVLDQTLLSQIEEEVAEEIAAEENAEVPLDAMAQAADTPPPATA